MKRVLFVGYSLTIQTNGYFDELLKRQSSAFMLDRYSIGGANLHSVLYLLNEINISRYDIVVFEVATSTRWLKNDYQRYVDILKYIIGYVQYHGVLASFLNFSRSDVKEGDELLRAICDVSHHMNVPCLSYLSPLEGLLYDGIHPNAKGVSLYASLALKLVEDLVAAPTVRVENLDFVEKMTSYNPRFIPISQFPLETKEVINFCKGGVENEFLVLKEGQKKVFDFNEEVYLMGFLLKTGPKVGSLSVMAENVENSLLPYDERSYYERFLPHFYRYGKLSKLTLSCIRNDSRPPLLKGDLYQGLQEVSIAGFFVSNTRLPF